MQTTNTGELLNKLINSPAGAYSGNFKNLLANYNELISRKGALNYQGDTASTFGGLYGNFGGLGKSNWSMVKSTPSIPNKTPNKIENNINTPLNDPTTYLANARAEVKQITIKIDALQKINTQEINNMGDTQDVEKVMVQLLSGVINDSQQI